MKPNSFRILFAWQIGLLIGWSGVLPAQETVVVDIRSVKADLKVPAMVEIENESTKRAGRRFIEKTIVKKGIEISHVSYLPDNWNPNRDRPFPVIIELPGNGPYKNRWGDRCSGKPVDCKLGYGISGGRDFIWVSLPFVDDKGEKATTQWWGDKKSFKVEATVEYIKKVVPEICKRWNGDPERVLLCGFSRGAIACNYVGLHDDEIASLWNGMVVFSHYDGVSDRWPYPNCDARSAARRLQRLGDCPQFICSESGDGAHSIAKAKKFIESTGVRGDFQFHVISGKKSDKLHKTFRNHNDAWILRPGHTRDELRKWVIKTQRLSPDHR